MHKHGKIAIFLVFVLFFREFLKKKKIKFLFEMERKREKEIGIKE